MNTRELTALIIMIGLSGCAAREPRAGGYAVSGATSSERSASLDFAEAALVSLGYTIARRDTVEEVLVTEPVAIERSGERSVRADNPLRKIAEVRLAGPPSNPRINVKVVVQEQSAETYRLLAFERGGDDLPGHQTAIDRDAATTATQNAVWRTIRRDTVSEHAIVERITEHRPAP